MGAAAAAGISLVDDVQRLPLSELKAINWRTTRSVPKFIAIVAIISLTVMYYERMLAVIFITYLLYGFLRPFLSRSIKEGIEDEIDDDEPSSP